MNSRQIYYGGAWLWVTRQRRYFTLDMGNCQGEYAPFNGGTMDAWTVSGGVNSHIANLPMNLERVTIEDLPDDITLRLQAFPNEGCVFQYWSEFLNGTPLSYDNPYFVAAGTSPMYTANIHCP